MPGLFTLELANLSFRLKDKLLNLIVICEFYEAYPHFLFYYLLMDTPANKCARLNCSSGGNRSVPGQA